ncbi:MAG: hypothetical protein BWZ10_01218 [candidate division BRC1 bacterium ADurb.BinA364]|nr:MAG: hypothetical protein BWZ10_01218 [candidate division BRC1 bacterium ADurb.BinA364]
MSEFPAAIERLGRILPEYRGYAAAAERRASDRALREYLLDKTEQHAQSVNSWIHDAELSAADAGVRALAQRVFDRLGDIGDATRAAPYAFGDFMAVPVLRDDILAAIYELDGQLLDCLREVQNLVDPTLTPDTDLAALARNVEIRLDELFAIVRHRAETISEYVGP